MMFTTLDGKECYIEKALANIIDSRLKDVMDHSQDLLIICQGYEGSAKSFAMKQLGSYIASKTKVPFGLNNIHFNTQDYIDNAEKGSKFQVNILDESRADLYRGNSNSQTNKNFSNFLSFCRSMRQIHIIILPRWDDLDKYVCLHRAHMIITMYTRKDKNKNLLRGFFYVTGTKSKQKLLKLYDKKYSKIPMTMRLIKGRFSHTAVLDEKAYERKKDEHRKMQFSSNAVQMNIKFSQIDHDILNEALITHKKNFRSNTKEYKRVERLYNRLNALEKATQDARPTQFNKGDT